MAETTRGTTRRHVGRRVDREIEIAAEPQEVLEAWAAPDEIARWFVDRADGRMEPGATVTWHFDHFGYHLPIEVYDAVPGERLAFGGEVPGRPPALQEVIVRQRGGATLLRVINSGFGAGADWDEEYQGVDSGWQMALATLKHWMETYRGSGGERDHLLSVRPGEFTYAELQPLFTTARGLASWLADEAEVEREPLAAGGAVRLKLAGGLTLDGEVLARTATEVLLSWPEVRGVLSLKCFAISGGRAAGLELSGWPLPADGRERLRLHLDSSLARLLTRVSEAAS